MTEPREHDYTNTPASSRRPDFGYAPVDAGAAPAVTIVTPFFNTGVVFYETARSVAQQSFQQWEWLIVNDGSTDPESLAILDSYRERDVRIRVIDHPTNRGLSAARNTGYREARADYVVQLDSDDLLEPTAIEKWFWFLESRPDIAFCTGWTVAFGTEEYLWTHGFHDGALFLQDNMVDPVCMVRRDVHRVVNGYDEDNREGLEDWEFWLRCAHAGFWGATVPEYLDWYRRRGTHLADWPNLGAKDEFREKLRARYPGLWDTFPKLAPRASTMGSVTLDAPAASNRLATAGQRALLIGARGPDEFEQRLADNLRACGLQLTVVVTDGNETWLPRMGERTPDVFVLSHFLRAEDYPRFLCYLPDSRQADVLLVADRELLRHMAPVWRARCPRVAVVDVTRRENGTAIQSIPDEVVPAPDRTIASADTESTLGSLLGEAIQRRSLRTEIPKELSTLLAMRGAQAVALLARVRELDGDVAQLRGDLESAQHQLEARVRTINEQSAWIGELERGKNWLEGAWKAALDEAAEHLRAKNWMEEKWNEAKVEAAGLERDIQRWQGKSHGLEAVLRVFEGSSWTRLGRRLRTLPGRHSGEKEVPRGHTSDESRNTPS